MLSCGRAECLKAVKSGQFLKGIAGEMRMAMKREKSGGGGTAGGGSMSLAGAGGIRLWTTVIALAGAGSAAAVRLATPAALDERWTVLLLFYVLPGLLILLLARIRRAAGLVLGLLLPVLWLLIAREASDGALLWAVPVLTGVLISLAARWSGTRRLPLAAALVSVALGLAALFWPGPGRPTQGPRVLLIGVDGASWVRIDPLVSEGKLRCLAGILEEGRRANLQSLPSMLSPRVWATIATGCLPEVHGIEDFANQQRDLRVGRIWDQLKREGRSFGVCGWYSTWPPLEGLGESDFMIPDTLAPDDQTFPPGYSFFWQLSAREHPEREGSVSYARAGLEAFRHGVRLSTLRRGILDILARRLGHQTTLDQAWRKRRLYVALQADIFAELIRTRRPEFAAVLFKPVDRVSHLYWKYFQPEGFPEVTRADRERYGDVIDELYAEVDRNLDKILRSAPEGVDFLIVSDHGFQTASSRRVAGRFCRIRTENLIAALGLGDALFGTNVDQKVYLRALSPQPAERQALLDRVREVLEDVHLSGETEPLFRIVREEGSLCLALAPRYSLPNEAAVVLAGADYPFEELIAASNVAEYSGVHHPDGVYVLAGPSAARAIGTDSLHVLDVAPTVAALLDLPISPLWPGRPALEGVSLSDLTMAEYAPPGGPSEPSVEVDPELKDKLKAIGYLE